MTLALIWLLAYLLGSIPFGLLLARMKQVDLRKEGSGNIGATNVARTLGKTAGILTLFGDCGKGWLACWLAGRTLEQEWEIAGAALMAFLGHVFSVFLKFKGGKGIATGLGIYLYLMPLAALSTMGLFIGLVATTRYVSLGSVAGSAAIPLFGWLFGAPVPYLAVGGATAVISIVRHRENIRRLIQGTENKFK